MTECEEKVLSRGLNFAVTPNVPPVNDIITATESAIRRGNPSESSASELRHDVTNIILQNKTIKPNISKEEKKAIKDLGNDKAIVIVPADKGHCTVVLDETDYDQKCRELLKDDKTYKKIGYNPTSGYRQKLVQAINALHQEKVISDSLKWSLTPPTQPKVPTF